MRKRLITCSIAQSVLAPMSNAAEWVGAIGTVAVAFVAVFQDRIRTWVRRPRLKLSVRVAPPDCHKTTFRSVANNILGHPIILERDCYYFRLSIENSGTDTARMVEVFAKRLTRLGPDGAFENAPRFTPMNLLWSHVRKPFLDVLSAGIPKFCDLGHVMNPNGGAENGVDLLLDLEVEPNMGGHRIEPGTYRLSLILAAANALKREYTLEIEFSGAWHEDQNTMFQDFKIKLVDDSG